MKKRVFSVCLLLSLVLFLAGCGPAPIRPQKESGTETAAGGRESSGIWFQPDAVPEEETNSGYYYSCLTEGEQRIYRQIYEAVREMDSEEIRLEGDDPERINDIYQYILYDHPELFWVDYYNLYTYRMGERIQGYAFEGVYSLSPEEAAERKAAILEQAETILAEAPLGGSEYEKIRYVYEYIIRNTDMQIALIPHVVWNQNDDRKPIHMLYEKFQGTGRVIEIEDASCEVLKGYIGRCRMFVGARTHATIAAYSSLVPTLVVGYSVKARGIARDLFGTEENYVVPVQSLQDREDLVNSFRWLLSREREIRNHLEAVMPSYQEKAFLTGKEVDRLWEECSQQQKI